MIFQPTNITPSSFAGIGGGTVSVDDVISISWQINGNSPLKGFNFEIQENTFDSRIVYGEKINLTNSPIYGTDNKGNPQIYTYTDPGRTWGDEGLEDGKSYKLLITQYWGNVTWTGASFEGGESVVQYSPSVFITRTKPTLSIDQFVNNTLTVSSITQTFTATYAQAQGDSINWCRWQLASVQGNSYNVIEDTGEVNTGELLFTADGLFTGMNYAVMCTVETQSGVIASTGWMVFSVSYANNSSDITINLNYQNDSSILVEFDQIQNITDAYLYRSNNGVLQRVYTLDSSASMIKDYGLKSGESYTYEVVMKNASNQYTPVLESAAISVVYRAYFLIEAMQDAENENVFHALNVWTFGSNINAGSVSNNNSPNWLTNFTPYRLRQSSSRCGKSGTLQALLSNPNADSLSYSDSAKAQEALYNASLSKNSFFLKDTKGNLYMVHISAPIVQTINTKSNVQEISVSIPWEETGDASNVSLIQIPTNEE